MEEQVIQTKGLSSFNGCSTSTSSCWDHNCLLDHKNLLIEKDRPHTVASVDVSDDNDPSPLNLKDDTGNLILSAWAGLPRTSHGFFAPATPNHAEKIGASSSGGGGHTDSSSKEEEEEEEEEEERYFHRYEEEDELEEDEGEDISVDLTSCSGAAAGEAAADDDRKKSLHTKYPSCSECGRKFPSWKAVFGHMRCHPERDWRGIRPAMQKNPIKNYVIFRSPITGKRSKRPKPRRATSLPLPELNIEEQETADFLLMLSSAARTIEEKTNHRLVLPSLSSSSSSSLRVPELIETQSDSIDGNEEEDLVAHTIITTTNMREDGKKTGEAMNKDTQRRRKKAASVGNIIDEGKYECSACKKMFASHQALGGHRASHRKLKGCFAKTISNASGEDPTEKSGSESEGEETKEEVVREEVNISPPPPQINKGHECRICHRVFETGQALGGHKRCHWNGERIVKQKKQKKTEGKGGREEAEEEEEERRLLLLLDLNLPPPLDEEDLSVLNGATQSKTMSNPNNLLPQKAKAKIKKRYYYCHLCNETFASREALCKHQNSHAGSSFMPLVLTLSPQ